jgi:hypothetical protein
MEIGARPNRKLCGYVVVMVLLVAGVARAGESETEKGESTWKKIVSKFEFNGYIENETAFRLHSPYHFSKVQNLLQVEVKVHPLDWLNVHALAWAKYDATYDIYHSDYSENVRDEYRSNFTSDDVFQQTFRELYLDLSFDFMDVRLGRQQVIWGEAIGLRITDMVNPQDFREFILDDFIDSRIPLWMAKVDVYAGDWTFTALWIPFFVPNRFAFAGSDWEWTFNKPEAPSGTTMVINDPEEPATVLGHGEFGGRASGLLAGWNVAASYLYTWDDSPALHGGFNPQTSTLTLNPRYHRMHVSGLTFTNAFGPFVPHGEISYSVGKFFPTDDRAAPDGLVKKQFLHYMVGTDYKVWDLLLNLQFIQKIIFDHEDGIYEDQVQNSLSFWIQGKFLSETLRPELLAIYVLNDGGWWIRAKVAYDLTDTVMATTGCDILIGGSRTFLGQFDSSDRMFVEMKYSF